MSITATGVPSEQVFSRAGDIITKKRIRMLESSCNTVLLVKSWLGQEDVDLKELEAESDLECTGPGKTNYEANIYAANIDLDEEPNFG
jgi:hypothetical protein